jgi:hypothetical protein
MSTVKKRAPIELSEYAEKAGRFDDAIWRLARAKPVHRVASKPKPAKNPKKRGK